MLRPGLDKETDQVRADFQSARPFRHVCIENFLAPENADTALRDFPPFDAGAARNEFGEVGLKAVNTNLPAISPFYRELSDYLVSDAFMAQMSALTGIADLQPDPDQYGGGTHENLNGHSLDPHVDFNYDQSRTRHRRLNLLIYLNTEWDESWGGAIELHRDPRNPAEDQSVAYQPVFNRAVLFETNEHSWHGFRRIAIPDDAAVKSRKCLSIYLYTKTRPEAEIAPEHGTFYVPPPLPGHIAEGRTLTAEDMAEIDDRLKRWSHWLKFHQSRELQLAGRIDELNEEVRSWTKVRHGVRFHTYRFFRHAGALVVAVLRAPFNRLGGGRD